MTSCKANNINWILEYWQAIEGGAIVSAKVKRQMALLVKDIYQPGNKWHFDNSKANRAIEFIERFCKHSKGTWGGKPFILELWQKAFVSAIFGFVDKDGRRRFTEAWLMIGRKNGKSELASAVGLYMMIADGEPGAEIYCAATKRDQAKLIWQEAKRMVEKSPALRKKIKCLVAEMNSKFNDSVFKPLGADSNTLDGLNVHCGLLDEVHAWADKNLYDVIADGTSARQQALILGLTTMGTVREGIFDIKYDEIERNLNNPTDERLLAFVYELDDRAEWTDPKMWVKANPGLGTIKGKETLARKVAAAQANSVLVNNLLCKDFNVRSNSAVAYLTFDEILNKAMIPDGITPKYAIGGADLSRTTDLTAAAIIYKTSVDGDIYCRPMFWIPEDTVESHVHEDKIPYDVWIEKGWVRTCPGNKIDYHMVTNWFLEMEQELGVRFIGIGYDAWSATYWADEMAGIFSPDTMMKVHQGKQTLSLPMGQLRSELQAKHVIYNDNPPLKWCMSNVVADVDKNGNIQPKKGTNPRRRIDGFAALLNAYVVYLARLEEYNKYC